MAEFKREFTQREEPQINADVKAEAFDKGNLYKLQAAGIENYGMIGQDLYSMNEKINNAQKRTVSNKIRINFDTFAKNEQQIMATNPNRYFSNYAENQQRGKKQLEDTFKQINSTGLFNRNEMDDLAIEMQGQYNNYFLQNNVAYARYQKDSAIASTDELMNEYKDLIRSNADDYAGVNRYLGLMEEMNFGLADFLEPEALLKEQMEFSNYRDTVAGDRIENFLDSSASKLEKDLQRQIANGATLDEIKKGREDYVKMIRDTLSDPNFSLGTVTAQNFESVVNRKFIDPVVNKAFDNAENQVVVNDVFNQVMTLIEKDGQTKNIEEHINSVTLKNLEKLYKEGNIPAEKVMQIKGQVLGKLDEAKASDIMKKMVGKGSPENMIALQKKGAELQLKPHENGLTGYGNVGGAVSAAIQMENALIAQNAQNAAKTVVRTRGGRTGSRSNNSSSSSSPTVTINSNGQIVRQQASIIPNSSTYKGSLYGGIMSSYTQKGAEATMRLMQQNGVINGSRGGTKQSRSAYTMSNNVSKAWNERGSAAIAQFMPNLVKDGMITQTNQFAPLLTSNGIINKGTAKAGLELSYTSFTNVATRDSNNNLIFTPKQMYYELVAKSTQKGPNGEKPSGKRFTLFNLDSPEIQELLGMGIGPNEGLSSADQVAGIKAIHNYFNDLAQLDPKLAIMYRVNTFYKATLGRSINRANKLMNAKLGSTDSLSVDSLVRNPGLIMNMQMLDMFVAATIGNQVINSLKSDWQGNESFVETMQDPKQWINSALSAPYVSTPLGYNYSTTLGTAVTALPSALKNKVIGEDYYAAQDMEKFRKAVFSGTGYNMFDNWVLSNTMEILKPDPQLGDPLTEIFAYTSKRYRKESGYQKKVNSKTRKEQNKKKKESGGKK